MCAVPLKSTGNNAKTSTHLSSYAQNKLTTREEKLQPSLTVIQPSSLATGRQPGPRKRKKHQTLSLHLVFTHPQSLMYVREIQANPNSWRRRVPVQRWLR